MHRLQQTYGERVDFISLDVDKLDVRETRFQLGMRNRSHYVLLDPERNLVAQWFGPLNESEVARQIEQHLAESDH